SGQSGAAGIVGIHAAGGIGGLLAVEETGGTHQGTYWYLYDANGNVTGLLSGASYSDYVYDALGNEVAASVAYADANPFRFSTKWYDAEVGLYYYGYRYYSPRLGRWVNRDPIGEEGGINLYGFLSNGSPNRYDPKGDLWKAAACCLCIGSIVADI